MPTTGRKQVIWKPICSVRFGVTRDRRRVFALFGGDNLSLKLSLSTCHPLHLSISSSFFPPSSLSPYPTPNQPVSDSDGQPPRRGIGYYSTLVYHRYHITPRERKTDADPATLAPQNSQLSRDAASVPTPSCRVVPCRVFRAGVIVGPKAPAPRARQPASQPVIHSRTRVLATYEPREEREEAGV